MPSKGMGGNCFIFSLLVAFSWLIASCLILWTPSSSPTDVGTWEATNGHSPSRDHHSHPSEEACHHLHPWANTAAAAARHSAGEAPASGGSIGCQGDSQDVASLELFTWMGTCLLAYFLWRCAKLTWTVFVLMVRAMWEVKRRARPHPPAPVPGANDVEGAPTNLAAAAAAAAPPPPQRQQQQGAENVPETVPAGTASEERTGQEVEPSPIVAIAAVFGSALPLSLRPPPPLPGRSISAPARLISTKEFCAAA